MGTAVNSVYSNWSLIGVLENMHEHPSHSSAPHISRRDTEEVRMWLMPIYYVYLIV